MSKWTQRPPHQHGVWQFDFRQVSAVKTLDQLIARGVRAGRIRRSLEQLRAWLPEAQRSLDQLALLERNGELLVRLDAAVGPKSNPSGLTPR